MKRLLSPLLWFSLCMLVLLPATYLLILYYFHESLTLNRPKLVEESSKVVASFLLSITALALSQLGEQIKTKRKAGALRALVGAKLAGARENIYALSAARPPAVQASKIEDLRLNKDFYESLRERINALNRIVEEAQQLLFKSEPEAVRLCADLLNALGQASASIAAYARNPSRDNMEPFKLSLQGLQAITVQEVSCQPEEKHA